MEPIYFDEILGASPVTLLTTMRRWYDKANSLAAGWKLEFQADPPKNAVILALSIAQLESKCGDIWPMAHNWGCLQQRVPNIAERKVLMDAGLVPLTENIPAGQAALAAAVAAGKVAPNTEGILWVDSSPTDGYYWVFFRTFPSDAEAAERFVHVLATDRPACKHALESVAGSEQEVATCMYMSGYYQGMHKPDTAEGRQANINSYASAMRSWTPSIRNALTSWYPGAQAPSNFPDPDPSTDIWVQWALNRLGLVPPLTEDGSLGPFSKTAIKTFQKDHGLHPDGIAGPMTRTALAIALKK
jgi:hypothetical protein